MLTESQWAEAATDRHLSAAAVERLKILVSGVQVPVLASFQSTCITGRIKKGLKCPFLSKVVVSVFVTVLHYFLGVD